MRQLFTSIDFVIVVGAIVVVVVVDAAGDVGGLTRGVIIRSQGVRVPILLL